MKLQLFKFNDNNVGLVNLAVSKMNDNGEMQAWLCDNGEIKSRLVTWEDLESKAIIVEWPEIKDVEKNALREVAVKILNDSQENREVFQPMPQLDEANESYKGHMVSRKKMGR